MKETGRRHHRMQRVVLLCLLVLLASAERRLAYMDFDADGHVRLENNEKPDGNEIINRLVFVDDAKEPIAPNAGDVCRAAVAPANSCARSLFVPELSESRAPPLALQSHA
jgi:hypothetical protein